MNTTAMNFDVAEWEPLVDLLRLELQEYGGLFNLSLIHI